MNDYDENRAFESRCWGAAIAASAHDCDPTFQGGSGHLKNKFCLNCRRDGILVPSERVRALSTSLYEVFENRTVGVHASRALEKNA